MQRNSPEQSRQARLRQSTGAPEPRPPSGTGRGSCGARTGADFNAAARCVHVPWSPNDVKGNVTEVTITEHISEPKLPTRRCGRHNLQSCALPPSATCPGRPPWRQTPTCKRVHDPCQHQNLRFFFFNMECIVQQREPGCQAAGYECPRLWNSMDPRYEGPLSAGGCAAAAASGRLDSRCRLTPVEMGLLGVDSTCSPAVPVHRCQNSFGSARRRRPQHMPTQPLRTQGFFQVNNVIVQGRADAN